MNPARTILRYQRGRAKCVVSMALRPEDFPRIPRAALCARLPLQGVFIAWVWRVAVRGR
jgi:uncharacterized membrane protein